MIHEQRPPGAPERWDACRLLGIPDLGQPLHFTNGEAEGPRGAVTCSAVHSLPWPLATSTTGFKFPCKILMPLWASCTMTCPDDFKSGEFLEVIRLAVTLGLQEAPGPW